MTAASADPTALPPGYVVIGHGLAIPAGGAGACTATAYLWVGNDGDGVGEYAEMLGTPLDMGPMPYAEGEVGYDSTGRIVSYTLAPGDAHFAIGDRLRTEGLTIGTHNHIGPRAIQPGQVLDLAPDPTAVWTP